MRLHPGDHHLLHVYPLQMLQQVRLSEAVGEMLLDDRLAIDGTDALMNLSTCGIRQEKSRTWVGSDVLNMRCSHFGYPSL